MVKRCYDCGFELGNKKPLFYVLVINGIKQLVCQLCYEKNWKPWGVTPYVD